VATPTPRPRQPLHRGMFPFWGIGNAASAVTDGTEFSGTLHHFSNDAGRSFRKRRNPGSAFVVDEAGFLRVRIGPVVRVGRPTDGVNAFDFAPQRAQPPAQAAFRVAL